MAASADKVFVDANILMELFFNRVHRDAVLQKMADSGEAQFVVSILSVDLLFYFVEKGKLSKTQAHAFLGRYPILDMAAEDYLWAADNDLGDFEDALQVACARRHGCQQFLTIDAPLSKRYDKYIDVCLIR